ncbi:helix-turn-helix domain-containing protein [Marinibaculum pumilum]|uniref:Helix-turn-helix domain-containing protein n=1 Tax=Marinibaculum pumilum TaxID=1766165 RepID=A0ABV7L2N1_9PROT
MLKHAVSNSLPLARFEADLQSVCGSFDIRPHPEKKDAWGGVATGVRAGVEIAMVATDMQQILRTSRNIRDDHGENYFLILQYSGRALMAQNDQASMLLPGDLVLIDSTRPSEFTFFGDRCAQVSLHLSRTAVHEHFGTALVGGMSLSGSDPTARAIHSVVHKVLRSEGSSVQTGFLRDALFGLIGAFVFAREEGEMPGHGDGQEAMEPLLARALECIETHFRDGDFSAALLPKILDVHPRRVQRAFEALGTTPTRYLTAKRLEFARALLVRRSAGGAAELISSIAYGAGFSDLSYFNRRFREVFGCAPGEYRDH